MPSFFFFSLNIQKMKETIFFCYHRCNGYLSSTIYPSKITEQKTFCLSSNYW
uniref:Uncharacterized protein n=1 Tax=Rhizophora mucronata TaxID=61149 RepID=A0A2P2MZP2_RHIMU